MKIATIKSIGQKLEFITVCLLILYFTSVNMPEGIVSLIKVASYGVVALLVILKGKLQRLTYVGTRDIPLLVLLGVCAASILWSISPNETYNNLKALLRNSLLGVYLATHYTPKQQMHLFALVTGIAAILSFVLSPLPEYGFAEFGGHQGLWIGIYTHKQILGRMMSLGAISLLITAWDSPKYRNWALFGFVLAVLLVLLSGSRTAWIALGVSMSFMPFYKIFKQKYRQRTILLVFAVLITQVVVVFITSNIETIVVDLLGKNLELSSRTDIWNFAIQQGLEKPLLGYGYRAFWPSLSLDFIASKFWRTTAFHAHNGFLDVFLQLGFIGLLSCCFSFFLIIPRVLKLMSVSNSLENFWMLQYILAIFTFNLTERSTFLSNDSLWIFTISICLSTSIYYQRLKRQERYLKRINNFTTDIPKQKVII